MERCSSLTHDRVNMFSLYACGFSYFCNISDLCLDAVSLSECCYLKHDTRHKVLNCRGRVEDSVCEFGRQCHPLQQQCTLICAPWSEMLIRCTCWNLNPWSLVFISVEHVCFSLYKPKTKTKKKHTAFITNTSRSVLFWK